MFQLILVSELPKWAANSNDVTFYKSLWISRFSMHKVLLKFTHLSYALPTKKYVT